MHNKLVLSQDLTAINCMNESTEKTLSALRQMKSDKLAFADFDSEDSIDVLCLKRLTDLMEPSPSDLTPSYIQFIRADSFMVTFWCQTQIEYFVASNCKVVSVDATGNMTRSLFDGKRRQFYYSIVYRNPLSGDITPIFQCISAFHDVASLTNAFRIFSRSLKLTSPNSLKVITVDFSFALMQTLCQSFNECNLYVYLLLMHGKVSGKSQTAHLEFKILASCSTM